jgi:hypothetical protein
MNARQVNSLLWAGVAALAVSGVIALVACVLMPLNRREVSDVRTMDATAGSKSGTDGRLPPLASFERIWSMRLREALGTPPGPQQQSAPQPAVATTAPSADAPPPVALVGTIGNSLAMLKTPNNSVEVCAIGETLNGVTLVAVRPAEVDVRYMGRVIKLSKPEERD